MTLSNYGFGGDSLLSNSSMMIRGLSPSLESVHPECAILSPEARSDIDNISVVMQENRNDVDNRQIIGSVTNLTEPGDDANFDIGELKYVCL